MTHVYISTKLADLIGPARLSQVDNAIISKSLIDWNAQLFSVDRRKCILVTNKQTLYSFVRLNILKHDLKDLNNFFITSLFRQLKADNLYDQKAEDYWLDEFSKISFARTDNDKKVIGTMNDIIFQMKVAIGYRVPGFESPNDTSTGTYVNNLIMGLIGYDSPLNKILETKKNA